MTELIKQLSALGGTIILRNEWATTELRGDDFTVRDSGEWLTIYHSICENPEHRSHIHLRKNSFKYACIIESSGYTPQMAFWQSEDKDEAVGEQQKPLFAIYFPSFFNWSNGDKTAIEENQLVYKEWTAENPREFHFK